MMLAQTGVAAVPTAREIVLTVFKQCLPQVWLGHPTELVGKQGQLN